MPPPLSAGAGNLILTVNRQRFHDDSLDETGPLGDVNTEPKARVTYQAMWPDAIGRVRATADYGTNGGGTFTRPGVAPQPSDTILVSLNRYGADGQPSASIDAMGVETRWHNDAAGRRIKLIENVSHVPGTPDANRTTEYAYTPDGKLQRLTLRNAVTGDQVTRWVYGSTLAESQVARADLLLAKIYSEYAYTPDGKLQRLTLRNAVTGDQVTRWVYGSTLAESQVARADLLLAKIYSESDDGDNPLDDGIDGIYDRYQYAYNTQGQMIAMTDPNGTEHSYLYGQLGRRLHDCVVSAAEGIDTTVLRISQTYEVRGKVLHYTSYDNATPGSGSIVNDVLLEYDDFGVLQNDWQSASGAVTGDTPNVAYVNNNGTSNSTRLNSLTINGPAGSTEFDYDYTPPIDDYLSRVTQIGSGGGPLVEYTYMGQARVVELQYPEPGLTLSYIKATDAPLGDGGDPYTGYDRFGRTVDMPWTNGEGTILDRFQYGYDRAGNRRWEQNLAAPSGGQDHFYNYDGLYQVTAAAQGNLNINRTAIGAVPTEAEAFAYDPTGNWLSYQQQVNGTVALAQTRTSNKDNQLTQINGSGSGIDYDLNGNATLIPPAEGGDWDASYQLIWDAWNRLVQVNQADDTLVATYAYDGMTRRLLQTTGGATRQYLFDKDWKQVLDWNIAEPSTSRQQYMWGAMHRDELILRDRDLDDSSSSSSTPSSSSTSPLAERLYVLHDYFNSTSITDPSANVLERYAFTAFGIRQIMDASFNPLTESAYDWNFAFQGQFHDDETGYYNYGYRYYVPELGRWASRDPVEETGGRNLYQFVNNCPINAVDCLGLAPLPTIPTLSTAYAIPLSGGSCGMAKAQRKWILNPVAKNGGYVIQNVTITASWSTCDTPPVDLTNPKYTGNGFLYQEAFVALDNKDTANPNDEFRVIFKGLNTKGKLQIHGEAVFYTANRDIQLPARFAPNNVQEAGAIPAATGHQYQPKLPSSNQVTFDLSVEWNCCCNEGPPNLPTKILLPSN